MPIFYPDTINFLNKLRENNSKDWFEQNRKDYEEHLLLPMKHLSKRLEGVMKGIDVRLETSPAVGKAVSRIYKDTRFSDDKTPFRTDAWVSFRLPKKICGNSPEFYLYFNAEEYEIGMGYYTATPASMARFRKNILSNPFCFGNFLDLYEYRSDLELFGKDYKREIPNDLPERFQPWFQKRNIYLGHKQPIDENFFSDKLPAIMFDTFSFTSKLYKFMVESND